MCQNNCIPSYPHLLRQLTTSLQSFLITISHLPSSCSLPIFSTFVVILNFLSSVKNSPSWPYTFIVHWSLDRCDVSHLLCLDQLSKKTMKLVIHDLSFINTCSLSHFSISSLYLIIVSFNNCSDSPVCHSSQSDQFIIFQMASSLHFKYRYYTLDRKSVV